MKKIRIFFENMKNKKNKKMGLNDKILDFEGRSPARSFFYMSIDP